MKNGQNEFWGTPPQIKKIGYLKKLLSKIQKIQVVQNCLKWRERVLDFLAPTPKTKLNLGGVQHFFVETEINQSCSKLPEMGRKLVENEFLTL